VLATIAGDSAPMRIWCLALLDRITRTASACSSVLPRLTWCATDWPRLMC